MTAHGGTHRRLGRLLAAGTTVLAVALVWLLVAGRTAPADHGPTRAAAPPRPSPCAHQARHGFVPRSISIPGITRHARVLALPRDVYGVPQTPPVTTRGSREFAWDRAPSPRPGSRHGNVLVNAHTWPWSDPIALGNRLLRRLHRGHLIVVHGRRQVRCYRVTRKVQVGAYHSYPAYYRRHGPPRLALMVCSGRRLGPGDWEKRTIWFARPVAAHGAS